MIGSDRYSCALGFALLLAGSCKESTGTGLSVIERWYQAQPGYSPARPAVFNSTVIFGTGDGQIIERDISTGAIKWSAQVGNVAVQGGNIIVSSGVVVAPVQNTTVGLDAQTGAQLWVFRAPNDTTDLPVGSVPAPGQVVWSKLDADGASAFIPAWGASVSAVDLRTGAVRWTWTPGPIEGDTAASGVFRSGSMGVRVSGDTVFATIWHYLNKAGVNSEAWVVAIEKLSGSELWRVKLPYQGAGVLIQTAPVVFQNLVVAHTLPGRTFAINRNTKTIQWEFTPPGYLHTTLAGPELYGDQIYVDGGDGKIYALNAANGTQVWNFPFGATTTRDMFASARRLIFTQGNLLYVLDRATGALVASTNQPRSTDPIFGSPPLSSQGLVFVGVGDAAWCFEEP